ncbi:zinc finger, CCHC-type [Artemisia annua]|uniref:Zinc finger, CCHC-type n=1 Tax=Artemisia annua TaxID=35608 RepID=A0A2U1LGY1_ARTAN|nr:zinc finger, CCHC-type [Artemisia annua]
MSKIDRYELYNLGTDDGNNIKGVWTLERKLSSIQAKFKSLGGTLKDKVLVRKLLNSVQKKFLPIVASIGQYQEIDTMQFEEAVGRITAFEERLKSQDEPEENYQNKLRLANSSNQGGGKIHGRNFTKNKSSNGEGKLSSIQAKFKCLGGTLKDKVLVRKLLNSVPKKFLPIVASIEQYQEIDTMQFEEVVGRITAFEERLKSQDEPEENYQNKLLLANSSNQGGGKGHGRNFTKNKSSNGEEARRRKPISVGNQFTEPKTTQKLIIGESRIREKEETVDSIQAKFKSLGGTLKDKVLMRKLLNSVPKKFLPIMASIEQYQEIDTMQFEEAVRRITAFEERLKSQDEPEENYQKKFLLANSSNQGGGKGHGRNFTKNKSSNGEEARRRKPISVGNQFTEPKTTQKLIRGESRIREKEETVE